MTDKLKRLLNHMEENIHLKHVEAVERLHLRSLEYQEVPCLPLTISFPPPSSYELFPYEEAFYSPEKMLYNELIWSFSSNLNSIELKDHFPLQIRSNHGVGIIASLFGAECKIINNNMPWIEHFKDEKEILDVIEKGIPEFTMALGFRVLETHRYYIHVLKEYPKCFKAIHITQPDLQGPFDIAHLLVGPQIFYQLYDNPKMIHKLLELITQTYIEFRRFIQPYLTDKAGNDAVYVHGGIYGGQIIIKDDTAAINLSEDMYNEFSKQYNEKIFKAFGKGSLHHCGPGRPWHFKSFTCQNLAGINYGNPEDHSLKESYEYWKKQDIPIIWWGNGQGRLFLQEVWDLNIKTGMSLVAKANSLEHAREFLNKYLQRGEV